MGVDWIRRFLGHDVPFRATDVKPPPARPSLTSFSEQEARLARTTTALAALGRNTSGVQMLADLADERDHARELADVRLELLRLTVGPFASHAEESRVRAAIRRHLRETAR